MSKLTFFLAVAIVLLPGARSWAGCENDLQCKGDRICHKGECVFAEGADALPTPAPTAPAPGAVTPAPAPTTSHAPQPEVVPEVGWSGGARVLGLVTAGAMTLGTIATGIYAAEDDQDPSLIIGGITTLVGGVCIPIVAVGASSARDSPAVNGWLGMRIAGWIAYGLFMLDAVVLLGLGASDVDVPAGAVVSVGVLGLISVAAHTADAWVSRSQAQEAARAHEERATRASAPRGTSGASILPSLTWAQRVSPDEPLTPLIGLTVWR